MASDAGVARTAGSAIRVLLLQDRSDDKRVITFDNERLSVRTTRPNAWIERLEREQEADVDCVVIDAGADDGLDLAREANEIKPSLPCILVVEGRIPDGVFEAGVADTVRRSPEATWQAVLSNRIENVVARRREERSRRYGEIMEAIEDGIYILDDEFQITWVNAAAASILGYPRDELVGAHATLLTSDETIDDAARISEELRSGERTMGRLETELETAEGDRIPIETHFTLLPLESGEYGQVGVFRDITERKAYERTLTALYDSTRQLFHTETKEDAIRIVREAATEVVDIPAVAVYLFREERSTLEPVAVSGRMEELVGEVPVVSAAEDSIAWRVFVGGETAAFDDIQATEHVYYRDTPTKSGLFVPLGDHGVLVAASPERAAFGSKTKRLTDLLGTTTEAALDSIDRENEIYERDRELKRRNRELKRLNRINDTIREIDRALVRARTRAEIEETVCNRLAADERTEFVWIGKLEPQGTEVVPRAWAGTDRGYLDSLAVDVDSGIGEPTARAIREKEPVDVENVGEDVRREPWRETALSYGYGSVVSVPLVYGDFVYGALTAYSAQTSAFGDMSRAVLEELGETIAYAINSIETRRNLVADSYVELELRLTDPEDLLIRLAKEAGCQLTFQNLVPQADGSSRVFFTATDTADSITDLEERLIAVDSIDHIAERDGANVFEANLSEATVVSTFMEYGAATRSITADGDEARVVVELPQDTDVRAFVETLKRSYADVELVSRRNREYADRSVRNLQSDLEERLTDRQLEVLRMAYLNGYFQWPRERTGEEVATSLGISQPTFNRHLREGERKLFDLLFGG